MSDFLQEACNDIIKALETAVQAAVFAKHIQNANETEIQEAKQAAEQTKNAYLQIVNDLYDPKEVPPIYLRIYESAILKPNGKKFHSMDKSYGSDKPRHSNICCAEIYAIDILSIIRQINTDFLKDKPREDWVFYDKPHLDDSGNISNKKIGDFESQTERWINVVIGQVEESKHEPDGSNFWIYALVHAQAIGFLVLAIMAFTIPPVSITAGSYFIVSAVVLELVILFVLPIIENLDKGSPTEPLFKSTPLSSRFFKTEKNSGGVEHKLFVLDAQNTI